MRSFDKLFSFKRIGLNIMLCMRCNTESRLQVPVNNMYCYSELTQNVSFVIK